MTWRKNRVGINNLLTILLPIKEGADFTIRFMDYLNASEFPFKIIIADGGNDENIQSIFLSQDNFQNIDYQYIKFPYDKDYSQFYKKMKSVIQGVKTPYISVLDNDCLPVVDGVIESVYFLEKNIDYSTCRGQHIDFVLSFSSSENMNLLKGDEIIADYSYFDPNNSIWDSFEDENPSQRILDWSHCMNITYFNIHKTKILQDVWDFINVVEYIDLCLIDITVTLYSLVEGKAKVLNTPFTMRQQNSSSSVSKDMIKKNDILDRMLIGKWTNDLNKLAKSVVRRIKKNKIDANGSVSKEIKLAIKNHYADRLLSYLKNREIAKNKNVGMYDEIKKEKVIKIKNTEDVDASLISIVSYLLNK